MLVPVTHVLVKRPQLWHHFHCRHRTAMKRGLKLGRPAAGSCSRGTGELGSQLPGPNAQKFHECRGGFMDSYGEMTLAGVSVLSDDLRMLSPRLRRPRRRPDGQVAYGPTGKLRPSSSYRASCSRAFVAMPGGRGPDLRVLPMEPPSHPVRLVRYPGHVCY